MNYITTHAGPQNQEQTGTSATKHLQQSQLKNNLWPIYHT